MKMNAKRFARILTGLGVILSIAVVFAAVPSAPTGLTCTASTSYPSSNYDNYKFEWDENDPGDDVDYYEVAWKEHDSGHWDTQQTHEPDVDHYENLYKGCKYYYKVRAHNDDGWGSYSSQLTKYTTPNIPPTPRTATFTGTESSCEYLFDWGTSTDDQSPSKYKLQLYGDCGAYEEVNHPTSQTTIDESEGIVFGDDIGWKVAAYHSTAGWGPFGKAACDTGYTYLAVRPGGTDDIHRDQYLYTSEAIQIDATACSGADGHQVWGAREDRSMILYKDVTGTIVDEIINPTSSDEGGRFDYKYRGYNNYQGQTSYSGWSYDTYADMRPHTWTLNAGYGSWSYDDPVPNKATITVTWSAGPSYQHRTGYYLKVRSDGISEQVYGYPGASATSFDIEVDDDDYDIEWCIAANNQAPDLGVYSSWNSVPDPVTK
jgi:hypothetical protein